MVNDKLPSDQQKEEELLENINEIRKTEKKSPILLKDMVENQNKLDKKTNYTFRLNDRLMDNLKSYAELKGMSLTDTITNAIKKELESKILLREELNEPVPVYTDINKTEFLGYVNWNNYLDVWNGETYCYENSNFSHKGISRIILNNKNEYVRIELYEDVEKAIKEKSLKAYFDIILENIRDGSPKEYIGVIMSEKEVIKEIMKAGHADFLLMFPELKDKLKKLTDFEENYNKKGFPGELNNLSLFMNIHDLIEDNKRLDYLFEDLKKNQLTSEKKDN